MKTSTFVTTMHEDYGTVGFKPLWLTGQTDPLDALGAAHDVIEHTANDPCEFPALGAILWTRGVGGWFANQRNRNPDPVYHASSEVVELARIWDRGSIPDPGKVRPVTHEWLAEMIEETIKRGIESYLTEARCEDPDYDQAEDEWVADDNVDRMRRWMHKGARAAMKRWPVAEEASCAFTDLERQLAQVMQEIEEIEGVRVTVRRVRNTYTVRHDGFGDE